jgi:hypothetical protein
MLAFLWGSQTTGLVSSNDGSHLALARALAVRHETSIDPEMALTLRVDLAAREGHYYSDRPPGAALLALPATWIGDALDPALLSASQKRGDMLVAPACDLYLFTYVERVEGAPPLAGYMGTALLLAFHTVLLGLLGLWCVDQLLRRRQVDLRGRLVTLAAIGLGTLWGPYATLLFSHGSAMALLAAYLLALERGQDDGAPSSMWMVAGLLGAWVVAADYLLVAVVVPLTVIKSAPRVWPRILAGTLPVAIVVGAYHAAAFGSPFSFGYQNQQNFGFAREVGTTFGGNPVAGLWTLLGMGHDGAGLFVQSPVALLAAAGLAISRRDRKLVFAWLPWFAILIFHETPWGGATGDYRYATPLLVLLALGFGHAWQRWIAGWRAWWLISMLIALSAWMTWSRFLGWHETPAFTAPLIGAGVAAVAALAWLGWQRLQGRSNQLAAS